ncbi:unnamed protein product, partial [Didymodactylos carnosus]
QISDLELEHHPPIFIFGRAANLQRSVGFYSDTSHGYAYTNQITKSQPLAPFLLDLLEKVNNVLKTNFNGILINSYENGCETIGAHSDDERGLDDTDGNRRVASISLGI